jgi:hypothetical protein
LVRSRIVLHLFELLAARTVPVLRALARECFTRCHRPGVATSSSPVPSAGGAERRRDPVGSSFCLLGFFAANQLRVMGTHCLTRRREDAKNNAGTGAHLDPAPFWKGFGVATSSSPVPSAGGATEDRPGRKPGFTGPPAARAPAGRQNPAAPAALAARIVRRRGKEVGSCRFPFCLLEFFAANQRRVLGRSVSHAKPRRMRQERLFACATVRERDSRASFEIRPSSSRPSRLRVRQKCGSEGASRKAVSIRLDVEE